MKDLNLIRLLAVIGEKGNFTEAGRALSMSPSAVSKAVVRLEKEVGAHLVNRTTRRVVLTESGSALHERFRHILSEIDEAENVVARTSRTLRGILRVQMPIVFGRKVVSPMLARFAQDHPELTIDVELSDRIPDLISERIDVAIRVGEVLDPGLVAVRLCTLRDVTCAAPSYLAAAPPLRSPEDLRHHRCLSFFNPYTGERRAWRFVQDGKPTSVSITGYLNFNNTESLVDAAIAGAGVTTVSTFVVAEAVRSRKLEIVLGEYAVTEGLRDVFAVCLPHSRHTPRARLFLEFLRSLVPAKPPWDEILRIHRPQQNRRQKAGQQTRRGRRT